MNARLWTMWAMIAVGVPATARAQQTVDPVSTTAISGFRSSRVTWLGFGPGRYGLNGLQWQESWDKPCWMSVFQHELYGPDAWETATLNLCSGNAPSNKVVTFTDNPRYYIRGIAVCNNDSNNHRLKGVQIYPAKVWAHEDRLDRLSATQQADRTNCRVWDSAVYCAADAIATGIEVHHDDNEITGLALRCRRVEF